MQSFSYLCSLVISFLEKMNVRRCLKQISSWILLTSPVNFISIGNHIRFYSELDWMHQCPLVHDKGSRTYTSNEIKTKNVCITKNMKKPLAHKMDHLSHRQQNLCRTLWNIFMLCISSIYKICILSLWYALVSILTSATIEFVISD